MKKLHLTILGAVFASLLLFTTLSAAPSSAQCPEDDPDCPLEPPQSEQIDTDPINADGSSGEADDPGAIKPIESDLDGQGPEIIAPVPLASGSERPPNFDKIQIPVRWQEPTDVSCGVQALGMAFDGLGGGTPTSDAILEHLESNNMMYDFGTGVEELAHTAQNFGYKGSRPFHNWSLSDLQDELNEGRAPVVAIGTNGEGQPGHFVTVTGISPDGKWVSYNDPTLGEQTVTVDEFNERWGLQGNSGVAVRKTIPAGEENIVPWVAFAATLMAIISQTPLALKRMGIGGRVFIDGVGTRRRRSTPKRVIRRAPPRRRVSPPRPKPKPPARTMPPRRFRPRSRTTTVTPKPSPQPDPSPQMRNDALPLSPQRWKEKILDPKTPGTPQPPVEGTPTPPPIDISPESTVVPVPLPTPEILGTPVPTGDERRISSIESRENPFKSLIKNIKEAVDRWEPPTLDRFIRRPPSWLGLSYQAKPFSVSNFGIDELVTYQPTTRDPISYVTHQRVSVTGGTKYKITSNPSAPLNINFANGRITFKGKEQEDGSRVDWFVQPGSLSFGSISSMPIDNFVDDEWDSSRAVNVTTGDIDLFGPNWISLKVSHSTGTSLSSTLNADHSEYQYSATNFTKIDMDVHRYPRILAAVGVGVLAYLASPAIIAALPTLPALPKLGTLFGSP